MAETKETKKIEEHDVPPLDYAVIFTAFPNTPENLSVLVSVSLILFQLFYVIFIYNIPFVFHLLLIAFNLYVSQKISQGRLCPPVDMKGKTVIITGSNTGIGKTTAMELARWGARVIIACRDLNKGETAKNDIIAQTNNKNVDLFSLDLSSLSSVRMFVKNWGDQPVDVLINNAGVMFSPYSLSQDGHELHFASNHLGHFLLTNLLVENLIKAKGRVVNLSSIGHALAPKMIDWEKLSDKNTYSPIRAYGWSKLANILFSSEFHRRTGITCCSLHPGNVKTELVRHMPAGQRQLVEVASNIYFRTPLSGSQTSLFCATQPNIKSGAWYIDCLEATPTQQAQDQELAKKLWEVSAKLVGLSH